MTDENIKIGESNLVIELDNRALCQEVIASLIAQARQSVAIFSQRLEPELYNQRSICQSLKSLASHNKKANIRIICKDSRPAINQDHCMISLAQNLSSFAQIRKPTTPDISQFQSSWLLIDDIAYCKIKHIERYNGTACFSDRLTVKESLDFFNHAWEYSEPEQQTRRLNL